MTAAPRPGPSAMRSRVCMPVARGIVLAVTALVVLAAVGCRLPPWSGATGPLGPGSVDIRYYGHSMVSVSDRVHTIVIDPLTVHTGFPVPKVSADLVLISTHALGNDNVASVLGSPKVFDEPGVFILGDLRVIGVPSAPATTTSGGGGAPVGGAPSKNVMYRFGMEGIEVAHLGDLDTGDLSEQDKALMSGADIMFVPVGGGVTLDASQATGLVKELKPKVAVPVRYRTGPSTLAIAGVEPFLAMWPPSQVRAAPSALRVSKKQLPKALKIWVMGWH